jgi:hypothetical protein
VNKLIIRNTQAKVAMADGGDMFDQSTWNLVLLSTSHFKEIPDSCF